MVNNILKAFLAIFIFTQFACNKDEGVGGESTIKGFVFIQQIDRTNNKSLSKIPAIGEDVFISYGSNTTVDDRARIGPDGSFEFKYLKDGNYRIFVYSDDTITWYENALLVAKTIKVSGDETKKIDTLFIRKGMDFDDGTGAINGKIVVQDIDPVYGKVLSTYPISDVDVFLSYENNSGILDNARTGTDGSYEFRKLIDGTYKVFALSDNFTGAETPVSKSFSINNGNTANADTIFIKNKLDIDDGSAKIKGRIYVYNFRSDGITLSNEYWGQDIEVYLIYGEGTAYHIRVRTSYDGSFEFTKLIKGKYKIFVYSAHRNADGDLDAFDEDTPVFKTVDIDTDGKLVDLGVINTEKL